MPIMRAGRHESGSETTRTPARKRALPQSLANNGHGHGANAQLLAEQQSLIANGTERHNGTGHNGTGPNNGTVSTCNGDFGASAAFSGGHPSSPSKQRRGQSLGSWRERLMFAFGFVTALVMVWSVGIYQPPPDEDMNAPDLPPPSSPPPKQPMRTTANADTKSDKALLQPILGKSYKEFLSLRKSRFADVRANDPERCRHPEYYDVDYTYHNLTEGSYAPIWTDAKVRSHFKWKKKYSVDDNKKSMAKKKAKYLTPSGWDEEKQRWTAANVLIGGNSTWTFVNATDKSSKPSKAALKALKAKPKPRSVTFLHVGKAGGSSVSCNIKASFAFGKRHCPGYQHGNKLKYAYGAHNDSAISKQVSCYVHYNERLYCYGNPSFVVNVRNPIDRLLSWYLYEHRENWDVTVDHLTYPNRPKHCGQQMLFSCYPTLDSLATVGLAGDRPSDGDMLKIGHDLNEEECRRWAWAAVRGRIPASFHNVWNYEWYLRWLLDRKVRGKELEIFVLRIEHLNEDWSNLDKLLGGTGAALPKSRSHNNDASEKELAVSDKRLSEEGLSNMCRVLRQDIQVYKQVLEVADNLREGQVKESLRELKETCPNFMDRS